MSELKPCPFCGGKARLGTQYMADGHRYRAVECGKCGATTPGNYSDEGDQSMWDWSVRADDTPNNWQDPQDRLDALLSTLHAADIDAVWDGGLWMLESEPCTQNYTDDEPDPQNPRSRKADEGNHVSSGGSKVTLADTRAKLEADAADLLGEVWADGWEMGSKDCMDQDHGRLPEMLALLDRQAAITQAGRGDAYMEGLMRGRASLDDEFAEMEIENANLKTMLEDALESNEQHRLARDELNHRIAELEAENARLKDVVRKQADSFRKMEAELADARRTIDNQHRTIEEMAERVARQRDELGMFNAKAPRKRMPKKCVWPRREDGRLMKPGRDCESITFNRDCYDVVFGDFSDDSYDERIWCSYREARKAEKAANGGVG